MKKCVVILFTVIFFAASGIVFADNGHENNGNNGNHGGQGNNGNGNGGHGGGDFWNGNHNGQGNGNFGHDGNGGFEGGHGGHGCGNMAPEPVSTVLFIAGGSVLLARRMRRARK